MSTNSKRPQHVFIVRLWSETPDPGPEEWRGLVEHVSTREHMYFTALADMSDFIRFHLHRAALPADCDHTMAEETDQQDKETKID